MSNNVPSVEIKEVDGNKFTPAQYLAVYGNFKNVLISASAGSGKTYVMINRLIRMVLEGKAHLNEILCVTFTEFAAREMKNKLAEKIDEKIKTCVGCERERLLLELEYLPTAQISTIHAFCANVLREFFYEAGLDAGFKILDGNEAKSIAKRAIDQLFEDLYEKKDERFEKVLPYFFVKRKDLAFKESVIGVYETLISEEKPLDVLEEGKRYYTRQGLYEIYDFFKREYQSKITELKIELANVIKKITNAPKLNDFANEILLRLERAEKVNNLFELKEIVTAKGLRKPAIPKNADDLEREEYEIFDEFYHGSYESFKKELSKLELFGESTDLNKLQLVEEVHNNFCEIVKEFYKRYEEEKREENAVDFSDLEHLTYRLLTQNELVCNEIKNRFKCVFTDEYQDTSGIQEAILKRVANDNWFMVGDLKQSIYAFRGCSPEIFKGKYDTFKEIKVKSFKEIEATNYNHRALLLNDGELPAEYKNCVINLDSNFRSTHAVLDSVNNLFSDVMTEDFGGVDYKANPMTVGAKYKDENGVAEMLFTQKFDLNQAENGGLEEVGENENSLLGVYSVEKHLKNLDNIVFAEGKTVVKIIEDIINGKQEFYDIKEKVEEKRKKRITYGDITILLRNANSRADSFVRELKRAGIPVSASTKNSIGEYAEVQLAINVLQLINGFNQDIPLVAVLKSPIGKVTDSELMQIRKNCERGSFYEAYKKYVEDYKLLVSVPTNLQNETNELKLVKKLISFDSYVKQLRELAEFIPCDELLAKIVSDSGWDVELLSTSAGDIKLSRLNRFITATGAKQQTVGEFLQGLEQTLKSLTMDYAEENSVKIMSIHASKGLEFPIVILAGTTNLYNAEDYKGEFIVHKKHGVAIFSKDIKQMTKSENAFRTFLRYKKKKVLKEEELRLLYVAMTRAKNRLYVTAERSPKSKVEKEFFKELNEFALQKEQSKIQNAEDLSKQDNSDLSLIDLSEINFPAPVIEDNRKNNVAKSASSYFEIFAKSDFKTVVLEKDSTNQSKSKENLNKRKVKYNVKFYKVSIGLEKNEQNQVLLRDCNTRKVQEVSNNVNFEYPYMQDVNLSIKRSVTSASSFTEEDGTAIEYSAIFGESSAEKGTAYHRFLEGCDFSKNAETEFNRLIDSCFLSEEQRLLIEKERLNAILNMPVFKELSKFTLYREQPFTCFVPATFITENYNGNQEILVQGIIDLLAVNGNEAVIVDYKFTTIKNAEDVVKKYEKQLKLYAFAVDKILKLKVKKLLIVDIYSVRVIEIPV